MVNHKIMVGSGYTDVSPKALVRTAGNRLYVGVSNCDNYPCVLTTQTLLMYRADSTGVPTGFTRKDSAHEPGGIAQWAVAIDGSDVIHVVFNTRSTDGGNVTALKYIPFNTSTDTWGNAEIIDNGISFSEDGGGQGMQSVALALDANGKPHIVYLAGADRRVYYRNRIGGSWSVASQLDADVTYSGNEKAWHPNLAFAADGRILAVWLRGTFNGANDGTLFNRVRATDGSWGPLVNLSGTNAARTTIDQSTSMLITPNGRYHVAWITQPADYIRYSYSDDRGITWNTNNPGGGVQVSHNPSLGADGAGRLRIYAHGPPSPSPDGHGDNLYYFSGEGGSGPWSTFTLYVTGAYDSSVNTRWSQFFHHQPAMLDIAYWSDPYPNVLYVGSESAPIPAPVSPTATPLPTQTPTATATPTATPQPPNADCYGHPHSHTAADPDADCYGHPHRYIASGSICHRIRVAADPAERQYLLGCAQRHARRRAPQPLPCGGAREASIRATDGTLRTLIDGAKPTAASLNLIDVNAPDVSYDGTTIVFAGLPAGKYATRSGDESRRLAALYDPYGRQRSAPGYFQRPRSSTSASLATRLAASAAYDDTDPAWLPDGRIVFSSTRWPSYGHYSGVRDDQSLCGQC